MFTVIGSLSTAQIAIAIGGIRELIQHRKDTGIFKGDVDQYCRQILDRIREGKVTSFYVPTSDGRIVRALEQPMPGGGGESTPEDATGTRKAEQERAAILDQE